MSAPDTAETAPPDADSAARLHRDWMTVWQSELAGLAVDRELAEQWLAMASFWTRSLDAFLPQPAADHERRRAAADDERRRAAADAPPGAAPADAPPDPRDAEIRALREHVAALELRLATAKPRTRRDKRG